MNTKHKNYEWIVAFAEGRVVQYRLPSWAKDEWCTVPSNGIYMFEESRYAWRIKPEAKKTVGYRRYVAHGGPSYDGCLVVHTVWEGSHAHKRLSEGQSIYGLVKWIDKEWQYDVVEEV